MEKYLSLQIGSLCQNAPTTLRRAMDHAVFPGGGRVRPKLLLQIARALGFKDEGAALAAASAVELIHCASLVHDDMPCFDNSDLRRGRPSVHSAFGERTALLVGDALIAGAFEILAKGASYHPNFGKMVATLAQATGASDGLVSGQAWEDRPNASVEKIHARKTGALFEAAAVLAALVAGVDEGPWRKLGRLLGAAYQAADDLLDAVGSAESAGKPVLQDARPHAASAVKSLGLSQAAARFNELMNRASFAIPPCEGSEEIVTMVQKIASRLCPSSLIAKPENAGRPAEQKRSALASASM